MTSNTRWILLLHRSKKLEPTSQKFNSYIVELETWRLMTSPITGSLGSPSGIPPSTFHRKELCLLGQGPHWFCDTCHTPLHMLSMSSSPSWASSLLNGSGGTHTHVNSPVVEITVGFCSKTQRKCFCRFLNEYRVITRLLKCLGIPPTSELLRMNEWMNLTYLSIIWVFFCHIKRIAYFRIIKVSKYNFL